MDIDKKVKKILGVIVLFAVIGTYIYHNQKYHISECNQLRRELLEKFGYESIEIVYQYTEPNRVLISLPLAGTDISFSILEQITNYIDERMKESDFIINKINCNYCILIDTGNTLPGSRLCISNYDDFWGNGEIYNYGAYMEIRANYESEIYEGTEFTNVKYLFADGTGGYGWPLKDFYFAEHFPNLEYLTLCDNEVTLEELEYIKSVLRKECVIEDYKIVEY